MPIEIVEADTEDLRQLAFALRHAIFVVEQGVPEALERDGLDASAYHAIAIDDGRCIATGRFVRQANGVARLGRMAVHASWRRRGLGGRVLDALEARARAEGFREAQLHAQSYVEDFYLRRGYARMGDVFEEAGIDHVAMRKAL